MQDILGGGFFFTEVAERLEFIPEISLKRTSSQSFSTWVLRGSSFLIIEKFLRDIFAKLFLTKSQASNL